jgi:putative endonuclease
MTGASKPDRRKETGRIGEAAAVQFLAQQGYHILQQNWRCRSGEIDIVAEQEGILVFIEVRTRTHSLSSRFGSAKESIDYRKQNQVRETAQFYLYQHKLHNNSLRFDVVCIVLNTEHEVMELEHLQAAF